MRRYTSILIAATLLLAAAPALADNVTELDRFRLWDECRPTQLGVEDLVADEAEIGLTKDAIEVAVRSKLRAARLYAEGGISALYVRVAVVGEAYNISIQYWKYVADQATGTIRRATTWETGSTGTHAKNSSFVLSNAAQYTDKFIDEYLRVNADACD